MMSVLYIQGLVDDMEIDQYDSNPLTDHTLKFLDKIGLHEIMIFSITRVLFDIPLK